MENKKQVLKELRITNDVYISFDGAGYGEPYKALEDAIDNCIIGLEDARLPDNHTRKVIVDFFCGDSSFPSNIRITDNGIGMSLATLENKLFTTTAVDAVTKAEMGGTSRWGLGYKQFCIYLGTPGEVFTREIGVDNGISAICKYPNGQLPQMSSNDISEESFKYSTGNNEHGTRIDIVDIKQEKWTASWWTPKGNTWYKSIQCRYNRLLRDGKLEIMFNKHTGIKTLQRPLTGASYFLDNGMDDANAFTDYENCTRNNWSITGKQLDVDGIDNPIVVNMGKHLSGAQGEEWKTLGDRSSALMAQSAAKAGNPTIYIYQNDVVIGTFKFKESDRTGGLSHLNHLFVEVDVPSDVVVPTNTVKSSIDEAWLSKIAKQVKEYAETIWKPRDVSELEYHLEFQRMVNHPVAGAGIRELMFEGIDVNKLDKELYHEFPKGSSRPDFIWKNGEIKAIIEFKDEKATEEALKQMAKYVLDTKLEADYYYLVAPSFNDSVKNTFKSWDKDYKSTFKLIPFDQIALKLS